MPSLLFRRILLATLGSLALSHSTVQAQLVTTDFFNSAVKQYSITGAGLQGVINAGAPSGSPANTPGANGLLGPSGIAIGPDNNIYYTGKGTDATNNAIYKYTVATNTVSTYISAAQLSTVTGGSAYGPAGIKFGPDGNLYIARSIGQTANPFTGAIDRYNPGTGVFTTIATGLSQPTSLLISGTDLYVSNLIGANAQGHGDVVKITNFTTTPSAPLPFITTDSGALENPTGLAIGPDNKFYVADVSYPGTGTGIRKYNLDGTPTATDSLIISAPFQFTSDLLFNNGKLIVANLGYPQFAIPGGINVYNDTTYAFENQIASGTGYGSLALNTVPLVPEPTSLLAFTLIGGLIATRRKR